MRRRLFALLAVAALLAGACGDDDDETATGTSETTASDDEGATAKYCEDELAVETVPEPEIDFENLSEEEQKEEAKKFINDEFVPLVDKLKESVPAEIDEPAQVLFAAVDKAAADGDFNTHFETPEVEAAEAKVHAYDLANCGWEKVDAKGVEYAFQGIPSTLEEGVVSFDFSNQGKELHELLVLKKKDGVTESFDEILAMDQEKGQEKVENIASTFAAQGKSDYAVAELKAGDYVVVCFVPVGTTGEGPPPENAPPHAVQGMKSEFKVS